MSFPANADPDGTDRVLVPDRATLLSIKEFTASTAALVARMLLPTCSEAVRHSQMSVTRDPTTVIFLFADLYFKLDATATIKRPNSMGALLCACSMTPLCSPMISVQEADKDTGVEKRDAEEERLKTLVGWASECEIQGPHIHEPHTCSNKSRSE